jgi:hypothetical protein
MVRCEYADPAVVIAGLDTEKSDHPAWSSPAVTGSRIEIMREQAAMQMPKAHTSARPGCTFSLFWSCFAPVIAASQATATDTAVRRFPVFLPWLTGK